MLYCLKNKLRKDKLSAYVYRIQKNTVQGSKYKTIYWLCMAIT